MSPSKATFVIDDPHTKDGRKEVDKLLVENPQELSDGKPSISVHNEIGTRWTASVNHTLLSWWPEITWCVFAIGLLAALIGLLKAFDGQPAPEWVSLNTVVAAISTICRAAMVVPVSEGLSQLKWNAFVRSQRPLNDLKTFDQASRGPFGSLLLLSKARGRLLGVSTVAALILISGLATSSLTQATIGSAPPLRTLTDNAIANKADSIGTDDWNQLRDPLRSAVFQALFISERQRENLQLNLSCPSSCHWNKFRSLDICNVQRNVTDQLKLELKDPDNLGDFEQVQEADKDKKKAEYWRVTLSTLGEGFQVDDINSHNWVCASMSVNDYGAKGLWGDDVMEFPVTTISTQLFIHKKLPYTGKRITSSYKGAMSPYRAVAVNWYWCVKEYEIDISLGTTHISAIETDFQVINEPEIDLLRRFTLVDSLTSERFPVTTGNWALGLGWKTEPLGQATDGMSSLATDLILGNTTSIEDDPWDNIMAWKEDTTSAMSAVVRSHKTDPSNKVRGYAEISQQTIIIRWAWLSLLVTQIVLMILFMIYVIYETSKLEVQVVKGSNIAELKAMGQEISSLESECALVGGISDKVDADLMGRLVRSDGGWKLKVNRRAAC
ncbi:hypothetical protein KAF25_005460 [Fusarium avenaceum]|uniref:Uncharacterized protein n=1 Tax=Fusarium avenaceum TaxID=40199 RepID=A0A9P7H7N2_9HYPO|nr:hypothetical protein KAF25_005460 [Fusarium avenaceum]